MCVIIIVEKQRIDENDNDLSTRMVMVRQQRQQQRQQEVPYSRSDDVDDYNYNGRRYLFGANDDYDNDDDDNDQEKAEEDNDTNDDTTNDKDDTMNDWWKLDDDEEVATNQESLDEPGQWWKTLSSLSLTSFPSLDSHFVSFLDQQRQPKPFHHRYHHHRGRLLTNTDDGWNALDWTWSYHDLFHSVVFLVAVYVGGKLVGGTSRGRRRRQGSRGVTSSNSKSFVCRDWIPAIPSWVGHVLVGLVLGPPLANWVRISYIF